MLPSDAHNQASEPTSATASARVKVTFRAHFPSDAVMFTVRRLCGEVHPAHAPSEVIVERRPTGKFAAALRFADGPARFARRSERTALAAVLAAFAPLPRKDRFTACPVLGDQGL